MWLVAAAIVMELRRIVRRILLSLTLRAA